MKSNKLEAAIRAGDLARVRKLIASGVDVEAALTDGTTPIQLAARERQISILRALAAAGAALTDLEVLSMEERLKLFLDASLDRQGAEDLLSPDELTAWAERAVAEQMDDRLAAEISDLEGPLFRAVRLDDLEMLKERLAAGDEVDQVRPITLDTPLTLAVQERRDEIIQELIAAGADVNHKGYSTPLSFALPDLHLARILIEAGADVHARGLDFRTPLERAVHRALNPRSSADSLLLVRFFLESGVHPPNAESVEGTLLMEAEASHAWELFQELLPHYPEAIARESFEELESRRQLKELDGGLHRWKAELDFAARRGEMDELEDVLARQPPDVATELGLALTQTLAHLDGAPHMSVARRLIEAGADLDATRAYEKSRGSSPLACAAESWHRSSEPAMRMLLEAGADVDQRGTLGRTPLMYAVLLAYRHELPLRKAVPLLIEAGANPALEDELGFSAWSLARAPQIEAEERARREAPSDDDDDELLFDGPDLSELFSDNAVRQDQRRDRVKRCAAVLERLQAAGAEPHRENDLRLYVASCLGDAERVAELIEAGASPDTRGLDGRPAIVAATAGRHRDVVDRLLDAGGDVDARRAGGLAALDTAVELCDAQLTRRLLDAGANVVMLAAISSRTLAAAEEAATENTEARDVVDMVRAALPPQLAYVDRDVAAEIAADDLYWESLHEMPSRAAMGDLEKVREMLEVDGITVDGFDQLKRSPLAAAAEAGRLEMVTELIAAGADVNLCNGVVGSPRSTPLICAAISSAAGRDRILRLLLEAGADPDRLGADGRTALMHAVERDVGFFGRTGELGLSTRTLIEAGADLEIRDPFGLTAWMRALSLASSIDVEEVAEAYEKLGALLEQAGASTADRSSIELLWAVCAGETETVRELLKAGADPDARRHDGATGLILAARDEAHDIAELLIDAGCDVHARQWIDRGPSAMDAAMSLDDFPLIRRLEAAGVPRPADPF